MRRVASFVARVLVGLAAAAFLVGALVFLLGLQLSLWAGRNQPFRRLVLAMEIGERAAELATTLGARDPGDEPPEPRGRRPQPEPTPAGSGQSSSVQPPSQQD